MSLNPPSENEEMEQAGQGRTNSVTDLLSLVMVKPHHHRLINQMVIGWLRKLKQRYNWKSTKKTIRTNRGSYLFFKINKEKISLSIECKYNKYRTIAK